MKRIEIRPAWRFVDQDGAEQQEMRARAEGWASGETVREEQLALQVRF